MRPVIGINCAFYNDTEDPTKKKLHLYKPYVEAIEKNGGIPLLLPIVEDKEILDYYLSIIDGLLLTGGGGLHPKFQGVDPLPDLKEQNPIRHRFDTLLVTEALKIDLPTVGICRGHQTINAAAGGSLNLSITGLTDITHNQPDPRRTATHSIRIKQGSLLSGLLDQDQIMVNSFHQQVVEKPAPGFQASAWSTDGLIEAIESIDHSFILGVQFHPETLTPRAPNWKNIFTRLITVAKNK